MIDPQKFQEHFSTIEAMLADMRAKLNERNGAALVTKPRPLEPEERIERVRRMLAGAGSVTAADIQLELGVSHSTAMRAIHALARAREGVLQLEPAGPTFRARLWHPERVILDHQVAR